MLPLDIHIAVLFRFTYSFALIFTGRGLTGIDFRYLFDTVWVWYQQIVVWINDDQLLKIFPLVIFLAVVRMTYK